MDLSNNKMRTVANLGQHLQFVSDSQDVQAIREHLRRALSAKRGGVIMRIKLKSRPAFCRICGGRMNKRVPFILRVCNKCKRGK